MPARGVASSRGLHSGGRRLGGWTRSHHGCGLATADGAIAAAVAATTGGATNTGIGITAVTAFGSTCAPSAASASRSATASG